MPERPSVLLSRAADLIRDTAAGTLPAPWHVTSSDFVYSADGKSVADRREYDDYAHYPTGEDLRPEDARWIALLNPAVAPHIEKWLRFEAREFEKLRHVGFDLEFAEHNPALAFARAVLGLVDTREEAVDG